MTMPKKPEVTTTFYANNKAIWIVEWYEKLSEKKIEETIKYLSEKGIGEVEALTDTTGRFISFVGGSFLKEVEA
jgi:hypothetical protein